jgi:hypothetical protein
MRIFIYHLLPNCLRSEPEEQKPLRYAVDYRNKSVACLYCRIEYAVPLFAGGESDPFVAVVHAPQGVDYQRIANTDCYAVAKHRLDTVFGLCCRSRYGLQALYLSIKVFDCVRQAVAILLQLVFGQHEPLDRRGIQAVLSYVPLNVGHKNALVTGEPDVLVPEIPETAKGYKPAGQRSNYKYYEKASHYL